MIKQKMNANDIKCLINPLAFYRHELPSVSLTKHEWNDGGQCPFHSDNKPVSFRINLTTGAFRCFSCGVYGGDLIAFVMVLYDLQFANALTRLARMGACMNEIPQHYKRKPLRASWIYHTKDGAPIGVVGRYQNGSDKKDILPFFKRNGSGWAAVIELTPRPLFDLGKLAAHPKDKTVFIAEGEKAARSAALACTGKYLLPPDAGTDFNDANKAWRQSEVTS
jgi:hypothetical protein